MPAPSELHKFASELDIGRARLKVPARFLFLCGGVWDPSQRPPFRPPSFRAFLLGDLKIEQKLKARIVLAESANQLFRDSHYTDLITFEEDIAYLASSILVIAESPGSLAELGAFSSINNMRSSLSIIMQTKYEDAESFVRFGPVERVKKEDDRRVGFFPWRTDSSGKVIRRSTKGMSRDIARFINDQISRTPKSIAFTHGSPLRIALLVYWIMFVSVAIRLEKIVDYLGAFGVALSNNEVGRIIYCMKVAGWVGYETYISTKYYYCKFEFDPFDYAFLTSATIKDSTRIKYILSQAINKDIDTPVPVRKTALQARAGG